MLDLFSFEKKPEKIKSKTPIICIHGLLGSSRNVLRIVNDLAAHGHLVYAYDQRGHGKSPWMTDHHYSIEGLANDLINVLDHYQISSAHLVGHSLGARVCLNAAAQNSNRVKSLCLLDAGPKISTHAYTEIKGIIDPLPDHFENKIIASDFLTRFPDGIKTFLLSNLKQKNEIYSWQFDLNGLKNSLLKNISIDQWNSWKKIRCPTYVLRGALSKHLTEIEVTEMLDQNPNSRAITISNAAHWLHVDNFQETFSAILNFIESEEK